MKKRLIAVATQNANESDNAAQAASINLNNATMNIDALSVATQNADDEFTISSSEFKLNDDEEPISSSLNFNSLFSRDEATIRPASIRQEQVDELAEALSSLSDEDSATLSFHQRRQTLYIKVAVWQGRIIQYFWTAADKELVNAVLHAMRGKTELLSSYNATEHTPQRSERNLVFAYLKEFISSRIKVKIDADFVNEDGVIFKNLCCHIGKRRLVRFYVEVNSELKSEIEQARQQA